MKRIVLDDAEVIHQGDRFVIVDGSPFEELMKSRWFQVKTMICVKVSLRPSVEAVYKRESFPIFLLSGLSLSTFISIGSLGNWMVLWYPYGYGKLVVSIYLKEKPDKQKTD